MIEYQVLGQPGRDNAVYVVVDSGQSVTRLLFDCGYGCLDSLSISDITAIDTVFFSHFHMDHIAGFDLLFRCNFDRGDREPLRMVGPRDTLRVVQHRLQGYTWNLVDEAEGKVVVSEFQGGLLRSSKFRTRDRFELPCEVIEQAVGDVVYATDELTVRAIQLDHGCISAGYLVREAERINVQTDQLQALGLRPGPWLRQVKESTQPDQLLTIDGQPYRVGELQTKLLKKVPGATFAYLTDFRPSAEQREQLIEFIRNVDVLVCENNYADADRHLAIQNHHLCSTEVAELAADASVKELVLFHVSDRYTPDDWQCQLQQVRALFSKARWPDHWNQIMKM